MRYLPVALFVLTPLAWFVVASGTVGVVRPFHIAGAALVLAVALRRQLWSRPVLVVGRPIWATAAYYFGFWILADFYFLRTPDEPLQQLVYVLFAIAVAAIIAREDERTMHLLVWSGPAASALFAAALSYSAVANGVNPIGVLGDAIRAADPTIIQFQLFRQAFVGQGFEYEQVRANMRHMMFAGILVSMLMSSWAKRRYGLRQFRSLHMAGMVAGGALILASMSRYVIVAAAVWPGLWGLHAIRRRGVSRRLAMVAPFLILGLVGLVATGATAVLYNRFVNETASYVGRAERIVEAIDVAAVSPLGAQESSSSHLMILDAWLRGGPLLAVAAVLVLAAIVLVLVQYGDLNQSLPLYAAAAMPLIRAFTSGGGVLQIAEWLALGLVVGGLAATEASRPDAMAAQTVEPKSTGRQRADVAGLVG